MEQETGSTIAQLVLEDLRDAFRAQFGENWVTCLHKNLRPSPLHEIAVRRGVNLSFVRKKRSELMNVGLALQFVTTPPEQGF
jgi:hypothetical protein